MLLSMDLFSLFYGQWTLLKLLDKIHCPPISPLGLILLFFRLAKLKQNEFLKIVLAFRFRASLSYKIFR